MFRSDSQRKAMFAQMQEQDKGAGRAKSMSSSRTSIPRKGFIARGQSSLRSFSKAHPYLSEAAIAIPAFSVGAAVAARTGNLGAIKALASSAKKISRFKAGAVVLSSNIAAYGLSDAAIRRVGHGKKAPTPSLTPALVGGALGASLAEPAATMRGFSRAGSKVARTGRSLASAGRTVGRIGLKAVRFVI